MNDYLLAIILMSLATQIPRLIPAFSKISSIKNIYFKRFLASIPLAALGALIFPGILSVGGNPIIGFLGASLAFFFAYKGVHVMLNILLSSLFVTLCMLLPNSMV